MRNLEVGCYIEEREKSKTGKTKIFSQDWAYCGSEAGPFMLYATVSRSKSQKS